MQKINNVKTEYLSKLKVVKVKLNEKNRTLRLFFNNDTVFSIPVDKLQGLKDESIGDLRNVEVTPSGLGLYWDNLDVCLGVIEILLGIFGSKAWMEQLEKEENVN